jgi:hypothetical protein
VGRAGGGRGALQEEGDAVGLWVQQDRSGGLAETAVAAVEAAVDAAGTMEEMSKSSVAANTSGKGILIVWSPALMTAMAGTSSTS